MSHLWPFFMPSLPHIVKSQHKITSHDIKDTPNLILNCGRPMATEGSTGILIRLRSSQRSQMSGMLLSKHANNAATSTAKNYSLLPSLLRGWWGKKNYHIPVAILLVLINWLLNPSTLMRLSNEGRKPVTMAMANSRWEKWPSTILT